MNRSVSCWVFWTNCYVFEELRSRQGPANARPKRWLPDQSVRGWVFSFLFECSWLTMNTWTRDLSGGALWYRFSMHKPLQFPGAEMVALERWREGCPQKEWCVGIPPSSCEDLLRFVKWMSQCIPSWLMSYCLGRSRPLFKQLVEDRSPRLSDSWSLCFPRGAAASPCR